MLTMKSEELKHLASSKRVPIWMIADELGISENTLFRWLRHDIPEDRQKLILNAITKILTDRTKL